MDLKPPFFVSEPPDIHVFPTVEAMASDVETYDLPGYEFFDAAGQRLKATAHGYEVHLQPDPDLPPEPCPTEITVRLPGDPGLRLGDRLT
jgi:hypothetical protein